MSCFIPLRFLLASMMLLHCVALDNGLASTPPMGWLSWERFRCMTDCKNRPSECISERLYMDIADRLVADGYRDAGYVYINIDDCWSAMERDSRGRLQADPERFPSGIKFIADYMHKRGLKLGIYGDMGSKTCGGYPGSKFYMQADSELFAEWGIDSFKMDGCFSDPEEFPIAYPIMSQWLNRTGRPILFSCSWPAYLYGSHPNYTAIAESCNIWRNYHDMEESWELIKQILDFYGNDTDNFTSVARPGAFNDPDMLIIGNYALSYDQQRVQMAMWAVMAAPLFMSNDLRHIQPESRDLLLNKNLIAINQDKLGKAGRRLIKAGYIEIWSRPISPTGSFAVAFLNFGINTGGPSQVTTSLGKLEMPSPSGYNVTEGFTGQYLGMYKPESKLTVFVNPTGVYLIVARPM